MNPNIYSPNNLMEELKARFPETHINIELSWDIHRSGNKEMTWSLYLSGDDVNIRQEFSSFPNLLNYANHLIAMHQPSKKYPMEFDYGNGTSTVVTKDKNKFYVNRFNTN